VTPGRGRTASPRSRLASAPRTSAACPQCQRGAARRLRLTAIEPSSPTTMAAPAARKERPLARLFAVDGPMNDSEMYTGCRARCRATARVGSLGFASAGKLIPVKPSIVVIHAWRGAPWRGGDKFLNIVTEDRSRAQVRAGRIPHEHDVVVVSMMPCSACVFEIDHAGSRTRRRRGGQSTVEKWPFRIDTLLAMCSRVHRVDPAVTRMSSWLISPTAPLPGPAQAGALGTAPASVPGAPGSACTEQLAGERPVVPHSWSASARRANAPHREPEVLGLSATRDADHGSSVGLLSSGQMASALRRRNGLNPHDLPSRT